MYSSNFGGIASDGQLHNMQREIIEAHEAIEHKEQDIPAMKQKGMFGSIFSNIKIDDLIIIAIGILLLMDGNPDNDILIIALIALLLL